MRKFLRSFVMMALLAVPFVTQAQLNATYLFSTGVDNSKWYTLTSESNLLLDASSYGTGTTGDSKATGLAEIGFAFNLAGTEYTQFSANSDGTLRFGSTVVTTSSYSTPFSASNANANNPKVCGLGCDGNMVTGDYIKSQLFGTEGSRVLVVEISTGTYTSSTRQNHYTFQIQLAEADNSITLMYSPVAPAAAPAVAHQLGVCVNNSDIVLFDNVNHTMTTYTSGTSVTNASGTWPDAGRYYTIAPDPNACYAVSGLAVSAITSNSVTVNWNDNMNSAATYTVLLDGAEVASGVTGNSYTFTGLTANTAYTCSVVSNCDATHNSTAANINVTTPCEDLAVLPYVQDFEAASTGSSSNAAFVECMTRYNNATSSSYVGYPYVGSSTNYNHTNGGSKGLYWYSSSSTSYGTHWYVVLPGIDITQYPLNTLWLKFWARSSSASYNPEFQVGVMSNPYDPETFELVKTININGNTSWEEYITMFGTYAGTGKYVAIRALHPSSSWYAYVDDITLDVAPSCFHVTNLSAVTTPGAAQLSWKYWEDAPSAPAGYEVRYKAEGAAGDGTTITVTDPTTLLTGLDVNTNYIAYVRANCGNGDYGTWDSITFTTGNLPCISGFGTKQVGFGTSTNSYIPEYCLYEYSYSQQIFTAAEIGQGGPIQGLAIMPSTVANANRSLEFYLGHVTSATADAFVVPADLTLVYSGTSNFVADEWNTFMFNTPFNYNGTDNLILVCRDMSGTWNGTNYFYGHDAPAGNGASRYIYQDGSAYDLGASGGSSSAFRNNVQFIGTCDQYATCAKPVVALGTVSETEATISWVPGYQETAWDIAYRTVDGEWTTAATGVTATTYTFTGLTPATRYFFRVQHTCEGVDYADSIAGRTVCAIVLPFAEDFEDIDYNGDWPICWNSIISYSTDPSANYVNNHTEDGQYSMYLSASNGYNMFSSLSVPAAGNNIYVSFWARLATTTTGNPWIAYGVMTDPSDTTTFIAIDTVKGVSGWNKYEFSTANLDANATYYVAFKSYTRYTGNTYANAIDDVTIDTIPVYTVTLQTLTQVDDGTEWGTVEVSNFNPQWSDTVTFTATPGQYKRTAAWYTTADTTGATPLAIDTNNIKIRVTSDTTITVLFGYGQFLIAAEPNQERMGTVAAEPASANNMYDYQSEVTLTATAADGFQFKEWLNKEDRAVLFTENPLTLEALQNYELIARFVIDTFAVDYTAIVLNDDNTFDTLAAAGTITGAENGLMFGEVATITAEPAEHYEWSHWATSTEDITSLSADQTINFRVLADTMLYPVFTPMHYTVTIENTDTRATYAGAGEYAYGDTVTISVSNVDPNYDWMGWMENGETVTTDSSYTFVIDADRTFFGNIPGGQNTVTFATNDPDMGSVRIVEVLYEDGTTVDYTDSTTLTVTAAYGTRVTVEAMPVIQYAQFNGWSVGTSTNLTETFTIVNDTTIVANFGFQTYNVTINVMPDALTGTATAEPMAPEYGQTVTFSAEAAEHWVFDSWTDTTGALVSTDNPYTTGLLFEDLVLTANFVRDSHNVVALVADESHGTTEVTNAAAEVATRFMHTDMATVAFTEGYGYTFAGWSDGTDIVSTDNPYTFEVEDEVELTATVTPIEYTVTLIAEEGGNVEPATQQVAYLSTATLGYTEDYGYVFDYWANINNEELDTDTPVITCDTTFVAHFKLDQFTITGTVANDYRMMGTVEGSGDYDYQSEATLTVNPNYGFRFIAWVDANGNAIAVDGTSVLAITENSITVKVLGDTTFFATFDYTPIPVTVTSNDDNFGTAAVTSAVAPYYFSQTIVIEATAEEHYHFVSWNDGVTDNPRTFILTQDTAFQAIFAIDTHTVTLVYNDYQVEGGVIDIAATDPADEMFDGNRFVYGTNVTVSLTPAYGFTFNGWSFDGENVVETGTTMSFTLTQDTTVTPLFTSEQYTITAQVAAGQEAMGSVNGTNTVDYMQNVILTATANTGYDFVNWTNQDGTVASEDLVFVVQALKDSVLTANFKPHAYTVTIASADEERGSVAWSAPTHIESLTDQTSDFADGTVTNSNVPVHGTWADAYLRAQMVYPAEMLSDINTASISSMTFYLSSPATAAWTGTFQVKVKEIESATLTGFQDMSAAATVYTGTLDATAPTMTIDFNSPVVYNGGNLLVEVAQTVKGNYKSAYFYGVSATGASVQGYNSSSVASVSATQRNFLPKVTFTYDIDAVVLDPIAGVTYDETDPEHIAYVEYQNSIAMEATDEYGYHFIGWTNSLNDDTVATNPMTVASVEADATYTANFAKNPYTITAAVGGDMAGTVAGTATVDYLDTVTLTATPSADHRLLRWVNANDEILGTDTTLTIIAERDSTITAVFGYQVYTLTANTEDFEMGGVYVEDPASMGAPMEIFADDFESGLANWTNEGDGTWTAGAGDYSSTTGSHSGSANAKITHSSTGNATKLISPVIDLSSYTSPELDFWFVNRSWYGDIDELNVYYRTSETSAWQSLQTYTDAHETYTEATFTLPEPSATYQIAFEMVDNYGYGVAIDDVVISGILAGVAPSLATSYADVDYTTNVNIYATPAEHYHFVGWMNEAGDTVLDNANEIITVLGDSTLTALFDGDQMPMTYQVNSAVRGSVNGPATGEFNDTVSFEAVAATGYEFAQWEDGYTENPRTVTVAGTDAENTYKAIFNFQTYDVTLAVENGELAEEIDTREIFFGTQLTVEAVANANYSNWKGWKDAEGNVVSTDNPYTFIVLDDVNLTGVFDIDTFTVTLAVNDPAMGSLAEDLSGQYTYGTELTAVAQVAGADYHFVNWTDATDAEVSTELEYPFTVEGDVTLTANFGLNQYNIATNATNGTAVWAGYDYAYPTVNITINAEDSYGDGWVGGYPNNLNTYLNIVKNGATVYAYTMTNGNSDSYSTALTADAPIDFVWSSGDYDSETSFTITVDGVEVANVADGSTLTDGQVIYTIPAATPAMTEVVPEGTTPVDPHTNLTFTATPDAGYNFVNWTDAEGNIVSSANPVIIEIVSDTTLTANFSTEVYTAYAVSTDLVKGTVAPDSANLTVESGALFTATPKYGYVFVNWTDKTGAELSTDAAFTLTDVTVDSIFANFNYDYFDVTVQANDAAWGTVALNNDATVLTGNFPYGDTVNVSATAADGYYFVNWTDNNGSVVSDQASARFIVEANVTYTANFADGSEYTITAVPDDAAHGQVTGAGTYMAGTTVTLTAVEFPNYYFTQWNDGNTDNPRSVTVTANADYIAEYDTVAFNVTVNGVTESVKYGVSYTAIAADSACRTFNGWVSGTETVASGNQYTFVVTGDITLDATYSDPVTFSSEETVASCTSYDWNGNTYTASGDYTANLTSIAGCDSTATLHLTVSEAMTSTDVQTSCGDFTWIDGITYTESNNTATYTTTAASGCDSIITLNLTINNPVGTSTTATECGSYTWNGTDYTTSGTYNYSYTDNNGCTVVDTLVLTINQPTANTVTVSACGSHTWNGETYTASGIYTDTLVNAAGCDSIVTLALTINQPVYNTVNQTACDSYVWATNGQNYTESGSYTATISGGAANGCDSIVTLNLTVNTGATATETAEACDSYSWNGTVYTESGTYTWSGTTASGCDSTVTLTLTVNQSTSTTIAETADESYTWNGMTCTESGTYTWNGTAANGCDSIVTLVLTINHEVVPDSNYYTVTILTDNPGMGTLTGAGTYAEGTIVTLTATPNDGFRFVAWTVNGAEVATVNEYTFTLTSDTTVTAVFEALPVYYTVTGIANDEVMGYVLGSGEYEAGATATLTAQANTGYEFVRWSNGHAEPTITFTVTGDITLTAIFQAQQPATGIDESDMDNVTIYSAESTIYVRGAEGKDVNVYDINGRTISSTLNAGETVEFRMSATGVYLVKVGNAPAKRVLVVR